MTTFSDLHRPGAPFVLVNVWDAGTARMAEALGAQALGTSSSAHAFTLGRTDGAVTLDEVLAHAEAIAGASSLPLSIDFEDGFATDPEALAANVRRAAETGAAGVSVEDFDRETFHDFDLAVARIEAAAVAAREVGLVLVARADGCLRGAYDTAEAPRRCAASSEVGSYVVYAPMLPDDAALAAIVALGRPVNGLAAGPWLDRTLDDWAEAGVARVSLGSSLVRLAQRTIHDAMTGLRAGDLPVLAHPSVAKDVDAMMAGGPG
ncbi:MAG: isocitrate lyase/PEP mutase family protein [Shimia sp.]